MRSKKYLWTFVLLFLFVFLNSVYAFNIDSFDITVNVEQDKYAAITERWFVSFETEQTKINFKNSILEANINPNMLERIDSKLKPKIFINDYSNLKVGFDEINNFVRLEYVITDVVLIKYLDYDNEIIWRFNDNLFRYFVENNLYNIPSSSFLRIYLQEPLMVGETAPRAEKQNNTIYWTGISSNELRLIVIEKKPPKPTFVIADFFEDLYLTKNFMYFVFGLLAIIVLLLIFKQKVSKNIKKFVIKNSKIKSSKNRKEIIDFDEFNK